jgi:ribosomal protein S18 acetylase RimI-like enzyme
MTAIEISPATDFAAADLHAANLAAFADYIAGPMHLPFDQWPSLIARQGIDLARSRVAVRDGAIASYAYVCPRPDVGRWRLAIMGALPAARGTGAAPALIDDFLARAKAEGMAHAELECFAANERALRLYRSRGFVGVRALNGWKAPDAPAAADASAPAGVPREVRAVAREAALAWLDDAVRDVPWLPYQSTSRCLAAQVRPLTSWRCGSAQLVFSAVEGTQTVVHSIIDRDADMADAKALAQALAAAHPGTFAPPIFRDDLGGDGFALAGWAPHDLNQVLMRRVL